MHPEYLYNSDTQDIHRCVSELAAADEPALRAHCQEVSRQTDTSSLSLARDCAKKVNDANATLSIIGESLQALSQALAGNAGVFRTQSEKAHFATVCHTITRIEEERLHLLAHVTLLTAARSAIASGVAEANRTLHFLSIAVRAVPEDARRFYCDATERVKVAYGRLTELDVVIREAQGFYMTMIERHLSAFMERIRIAADLNRGGEALDGAAIRTLCGELLILVGRAPKVTF